MRKGQNIDGLESSSFTNSTQAIGIKGGNKSKLNHRKPLISTANSVGSNSSYGVSAESAASGPASSSQPSSPTFISNRKKSLYKTEMCRSTEETGTCPYGPKCQFAHSVSELRVLDRHPRYKTEMCKTYWEHGTCPYGKRCCFLHSKKEEGSPPFPAGTPPGLMASSLPNPKPKGLSISTNHQQQHSSVMTLHSPRARTMSQGLDAVSRTPTHGFDSMASSVASSVEPKSPILSKLDVLSAAAPHTRTASMPLEIHTRPTALFPASPPRVERLSASFQRQYGNRHSRENSLSQDWDDESLTQPPVSAGLEMKKSWDNFKIGNAPYSASAAVRAGPFSSSANPADYPWAFPASATVASAAEKMSSPWAGGENISRPLETEFSKLSVATSFNDQFKTNNYSSFSAIPFTSENKNGFAHGSLDAKKGFTGSLSAFPDPLNTSSVFFPENGILPNGIMLPKMGESLNSSRFDHASSSYSGSVPSSPFRSNPPPGILSESLSSKGMIVGSPLATSFSEDSFGPGFGGPSSQAGASSSDNVPSSPIIRSRTRGGLRDVWSSTTAAAPSIPTAINGMSGSLSRVSSPKPGESSLPTHSGPMQKDVKLPLMDLESIVSPPATPIIRKKQSPSSSN